jgi:hypothetical protein
MWCCSFEIGMGLALLLGAGLARRNRFQVHALCQGVIVLLKLAVITLANGSIVPVSGESEDPGLGWKACYGLATAHAALGMDTEIGALYILLAAGTNILLQ